MKPQVGQTYRSYQTGREFKIIGTTDHFGTIIYNCEDTNNKDIVFGFGLAFFDKDNNFVGTHTLLID